MKIAFAEMRTSHLALTQLYRWHQLYERPLSEARLALQLEILDEDIALDVMNGSARGLDAYAKVLRALPQNDRNAHHVLRTEIVKPYGDTIAIEADVIFQRWPQKGRLESTALHYSMLLRRVANGLPRFTHIKVRAIGPSQLNEFEDAYRTSRARSFVHYWLALMEDVGGSVEPFTELLSQDSFALQLESGGEPITKRDQLRAWFAAVAAQITKSSHRLQSFTIEGDDDRVFRLAVDFDWRGVSRHGAPMTGMTRNRWQLIDSDERFLRLTTARSTTLQPYATLQS
jgi:hypothetical protein